MKKPNSDPTDTLKAHKLCMSAASEGWEILFCATQASMVTSAIATPAFPAVNDRRANTRCRFLSKDNTSMAITPMIPETIKEANMLVKQFLKLFYTYSASLICDRVQS